jgi:hypothetical protein
MIVIPKEKKNRNKGFTNRRIVKNMHNNKNSHFALFIIRSISVGKNIMLLKVLQAFVTIMVIMSRVMFLLLETLVVIMPSIIITVMWLS